MLTDRNWGDDTRIEVDILSPETFEFVAKCHKLITGYAERFFENKTGVSVSAEHPHETYTQSPSYFQETMDFHFDIWVQAFLANAIVAVGDRETIVDAGCAFGISGLIFAILGKKVIFHDYEGIGLEFLRWVKSVEPTLKIEVIPYGDPIRKQEVCLMIDVLEHLPDALTGIRWAKDLGSMIVMSYPTRVPRLAPYEHNTKLDAWVDDDAVVKIIGWRYQIMLSKTVQEWRSIIWG